jgi:preprotein translocase subunit SecA
MVSRSIRSAQTQIEQQNFEIRKNVLKYDEVLNKQRTVIYNERRRVLMGEDLHEQIRNMVDDAVEAYVRGATSEGYEEEWDLEGLWNNLKQLYPVSVSIDELSEHSGGGLTTEYMIDELVADAQEAYDRRESSLGLTPVSEDADGEPVGGEPVMRELERRVLLSVLDRKWREHLYEMDYLQEGIQLRSYGQRDPLVEYQREGFTMFTTMMDAIKEESVAFLFNLEVQVVEPEAPAAEAAEAAEATPISDAEVPAPTLPKGPALPKGIAAAAAAANGAANGAGRAGPQLVAPGLQAPKRPTRLQYSAPTIDGDSGGGAQPVTATVAGDAPLMYEGTPRNAKCPCGSGRAYKRCHGDPRSVS